MVIDHGGVYAFTLDFSGLIPTKDNLVGKKAVAARGRKKVVLNKKVPAAIRMNLIGDVYGSLEVVGFGGYRGTAILWQCRCQCGQVGTYYRANLRSGNSRQCLACNRRSFQEASTSHGMNRTPVYRAWERVRRTDECCRRWAKFENFYEDVGDKPSPDHFLVRKNAAKSWTPKNANWIHKSEVRNASGNAKMIRFGGRSLSLTQWAAEVGITPQSLRGRLDRGWSMKKAIETPRPQPAKKKAKKKKSAKRKAVKKKPVKKNSVKKTSVKKKTQPKKAAKKKTVKKKTVKKNAVQKTTVKKKAATQKAASKRIVKKKSATPRKRSRKR